MNWSLMQTPGFTRLWRAERMGDDDLRSLETLIMTDPLASPVMRGTGGLRKIRFAPPSRGKGKSGSMRVGYAQFPDYGLILLVTLFMKKDDANLSRRDQNVVAAFLAEFADELKRAKL
ncbi:MAG TPA: hypothetical protein VFE47_15730 [Tepidisphaeraceae bacterium]|jgi:hypothetical protein|nr:hypothetical protein [Tepidisphaeraceae bacterium]